jgi:hypothetical protein
MITINAKKALRIPELDTSVDVTKTVEGKDKKQYTVTYSEYKEFLVDGKADIDISPDSISGIKSIREALDAGTATIEVRGEVITKSADLVTDLEHLIRRVEALESKV